MHTMYKNQENLQYLQGNAHNLFQAADKTYND